MFKNIIFTVNIYLFIFSYSVGFFGFFFSSPKNSTWEQKRWCAFPSLTAAPSTACCPAQGDAWPRDKQPTSQHWAPWNGQMLGKEAAALG